MHSHVHDEFCWKISSDARVLHNQCTNTNGMNQILLESTWAVCG